MLNNGWSFTIREAQKSIIGLYLPGTCCLGNQICRCNYRFWHCNPGCSPPHTDIPKNSQLHRSPWDNLQAEWSRLVTWKQCFVYLKLLVHRHDILWGLIIRKIRGSSWLPKNEATNVFQIRQFICFLATGHEQWRLNYLKGCNDAGREIASQTCSIAAWT